MNLNSLSRVTFSWSLINLLAFHLVYWEYCGGPMPKPAQIHTDSSELTVRFRSSQHISGRGFLLSYSTENHKGILTLKWRVCIILTQHCSCVASALRNPLSSCLLADPHVNRHAVAPCCGLPPSLIWMLTDPLRMFL